MAADIDVATHLVSNTSLSALGTDTFAGPVRKHDPPRVPHKAVFCLLTGGPQPLDMLGSTSPIVRQQVQVRIRGDVRAFSAAQTLAIACRNALHLADISGYISVKVIESMPTFIGVDDTEHPEFSLTAELWSQS